VFRSSVLELRGEIQSKQYMLNVVSLFHPDAWFWEEMSRSLGLEVREAFQSIRSMLQVVLLSKSNTWFWEKVSMLSGLEVKEVSLVSEHMV
jgi:hypothetical protein